MSKRDVSGSAILILIAIVIVIFYAIVKIIESIFKGIILFFTSLFTFIYSNILFIISICLLIVGMVILIKSIKNKNIAKINRPKLKKKALVHSVKSKRHPLTDSLLKVIDLYGVSILSIENSQKCRGLLKDFDKNVNTESINIIYHLSNNGIYSILTNLKSKQYKKYILINKIYKKMNKGNITKRQNYEIIELIIDLMITEKFLVIRQDKTEINLANISYRVEYIFLYFLYFLRCKYRIIFSSLLSITGAILFVFCITTEKFTKFEYNSKQKYSRSNYTVNETPAPIYYYVNSFRLNLRDGPSTTNKIITQLKLNNRVQILDRTGNWWRIRFGNYVGYVNSQYLSSRPVSEK